MKMAITHEERMKSIATMVEQYLNSGEFCDCDYCEWLRQNEKMKPCTKLELAEGADLIFGNDTCDCGQSLHLHEKVDRDDFFEWLGGYEPGEGIEHPHLEARLEYLHNYAMNNL
tara:strand:- start:264 stop:605 length:342 start_codon:yes stop_codon:yes gene_type:complete